MKTTSLPHWSPADVPFSDWTRLAICSSAGADETYFLKLKTPTSQSRLEKRRRRSGTFLQPGRGKYES